MAIIIATEALQYFFVFNTLLFHIMTDEVRKLK